MTNKTGTHPSFSGVADTTTGINFEQDKTDVLDKSENLKLLSNEVQKMESLVSEISGIEDKE